MASLANDRWRGQFTVTEIGRYRYTITAWVDRFLSWRHDFSRRTDPEDITTAQSFVIVVACAFFGRASASRIDKSGARTE